MNVRNLYNAALGVISRPLSFIKSLFVRRGRSIEPFVERQPSSIDLPSSWQNLLNRKRKYLYNVSPKCGGYYTGLRLFEVSFPVDDFDIRLLDYDGNNTPYLIHEKNGVNYISFNVYSFNAYTALRKSFNYFKNNPLGISYQSNDLIHPLISFCKRKHTDYARTRVINSAFNFHKIVIKEFKGTNEINHTDKCREKMFKHYAKNN